MLLGIEKTQNTSEQGELNPFTQFSCCILYYLKSHYLNIEWQCLNKIEFCTLHLPLRSWSALLGSYFQFTPVIIPLSLPTHSERLCSQKISLSLNPTASSVKSLRQQFLPIAKNESMYVGINGFSELLAVFMEVIDRSVEIQTDHYRNNFLSIFHFCYQNLLLCP